ncbi:MAG: isochorismatase family protein [Actinomycetota bacterium]|nr:isochorismatase family protein [Actinomycetota bacterium]
MSGRLDRQRTTLVVVDLQEGFRRLQGFDRVAQAVATLVRGAELTGIPVLATEQYPKGLGKTVAEVSGHFPEGTELIDKLCFSAAEAEGFDLGERDQALVCGIETHVCVNQTVLDLLGSGVEVHVPEDAVGSRFADNSRIGLRKMERAGAVLTSVETALFELLRRAGTDEFKRIQKLILEYAPNPSAERVASGSA